VWNVTKFYVQQLETYCLMTHFQFPSLSYAKQTDNQKLKAIRSLDTSTLLLMKSLLYSVGIRPAQIQQCWLSTTPHSQCHLQSHSSLSLQTTYPFLSCCLFHDAISFWHSTVSSMITGRPNGHYLSDLRFSQRCSIYSRFPVS